MLSLAVPVLASAVADAESAGRSIEWPTVILVLGLCLTALSLVVAITSFVHENRKLNVAAAQDDALRQLIGRYEQLASSTLDAQQRATADVAELRSRTSSIEQLLRSVE